MDLFRIAKKSRAMFNYVSELLDGERSLLGEDEQTAEQPYEARADVEAILRQPLQTRDPRKRNQALFESLNPFFEAGFLLTKTHGKWFATSMFLYGKKFEMPEKTRVPFPVPQVPIFGVIKGRSPAVLKAFELDGVASLRDSSAFLFSIDANTIYLLVSEKPEPWLDALIGNTRSVLNVLIKGS